MKRLLTLSFLLLFGAGMAFGQTSTFISQNGSGNAYSLTQSGDGNTVEEMRQVGSNNTLKITQNGVNNFVADRIDQGYPYAPSRDGYIEIRQIGNQNKMFDADQIGSNNELYVNQDGFDIANVEAQVSLVGSPGNTIRINQNEGANLVGNFDGDGPGAYQQGTDNTMRITQRGGAKAGVRNEMADRDDFRNQFYHRSEDGQGLIQIGDSNRLTISQNGESIVEHVLQNGTGNEATITQNGDGNLATVVQRGSQNEATITQRNE